MLMHGKVETLDFPVYEEVTWIKFYRLYVAIGIKYYLSNICFSDLCHLR